MDELALERAGVAPDEVEHVLMGQVICAGQGQVPARQAAVKAGIPYSVPANTINKACLSGLNTIYLAHQMIQSGDADIVVASSNAAFTLGGPVLVPGTSFNQNRDKLFFFYSLDLLPRTDLRPDTRHRFVVEVGTEQGAEVLAGLPSRQARTADREAADAVVASTAARPSARTGTRTSATSR